MVITILTALSMVCILIQVKLFFNSTKKNSELELILNKKELEITRLKEKLRAKN